MEGAACSESTLHSLMDYYLRDHGFPPRSLPFDDKALKYILEPFCWSDANDRIKSCLVNFVKTYPLPSPTVGLGAAEMDKEIRRLTARAADHGMNLEALFPTMWGTYLAGLKARDVTSLHEIYTEWNLLLRDIDPPDCEDPSSTRLPPRTDSHHYAPPSPITTRPIPEDTDLSKEKGTQPARTPQTLSLIHI